MCKIADLREVRKRVLKTRYRVNSLSSVAELASQPDGCDYPVLVVCHSFDADEYAAAIQIARQRWPGIKILSLSAPYQSSKPYLSDVVVGALAGPYVLLATIDSMLQSAGALQA
ncbi:hypothetical protein [Terriglobus sp.]|uniref:hypothetical protein n=1 Tax=Terriglobus sp. TaxID=1889013 RepID=UPI003B0019AF